ncbi:ZIP family zinc transporter, partial [Streptomyces sp. SID5475]|nr:ZIP family zinc transporter [Streptomyces sp. SID5475]
MPQVLEAGWWGLVAGSALLIGALIGFTLRVPRLLIASVMAFGAGVLLSAVSFELLGEAYGLAGPAPAVIG